MKTKKILEALKQTDTLGMGLSGGCAITQLFLACGKTKDEILAEKGKEYLDFFNGLLAEEYDLIPSAITNMWQLNDCEEDETSHERHKRVVAHYEALA